MLTNSKIALSVALVLATASAAIAAPKHAVRHQTTVTRQVPADTYLSFARHQGGTYLGVGSARASGSANEPCYLKIQDIGIDANNGVRPTSYSCARR
jgi:hypothetical protein